MKKGGLLRAKVHSTNDECVSDIDYHTSIGNGFTFIFMASMRPSAQG